MCVIGTADGRSARAAVRWNQPRGKGKPMERSLVIAVFSAADARFDPCGAASFAQCLGHEIDAGRIAFPRPLVVGGGRPHGCLVLDCFPADLAGLARTARTLTRGLADLAGAGFTIGVCGAARFDVVIPLTQVVTCELKSRRGGAGSAGWTDRNGRIVIFAVL
jgi:hypothetical protein